MTEAEFTARTLAAALLAVEWSLPSLQARTARVLGIPKEPIYSTQIKLIEELFAETPRNYPPSPEWIVRRLLENSDFHDSVHAPQRNTASVSPALSSPLFAPTPRFAGLDIPRLATPGELAAWAGLTIAELDWFTDARRQQGNTDIPILRHYTYAFIAKRSGPPRLVEQPKPRLKAIQRRILRDILDKVPAHPAAHGFVAGRSCLTGAAAHAGEAVVATADLRDFFLTTPLKRVHGVFRSLGFPWAVARALTSLCATATPASVFLRLAAAQRHDHATRRMFRSQHLPQGAPTSPALANLAAWGLDQRLAGLAGRLARVAAPGDEFIGALPDLLLVTGIMAALIAWEAIRYAETRHRIRHLDGHHPSEQEQPAAP